MKQFFTLLGVVWTVACWSLAPSGIAAEGTGNRAWLQSTTISGAVADEDGNPLVGATVQAFNTQQNRVVAGAYTDEEGRFSIQLASTADVVIRISYVGYRTEEVALSQGVSALEIQMQLDAAGLDEVLVVGYGTAYKRDITGSVATVRGQDIENLPVNTLENAIQGRMAGVQITQGSGKLGQGISIRVRGSASVTASNQPLFVVDGIPVISEDRETLTGEPTNPISELNPNDIESIQVLKDASAAAIYGSRASNGVVIITTKRGLQGKSQFNISYFYAIQSPTNKREFLNADEYVAFFEEANGGLLFARDEVLAGREFETDWQDEMLVNSGAQQWDFNMRGGSEKTQFFFSVQYSDQEGILLGNRFQRVSARANVDHKVNDWFKIGISQALAQTRNNRVSNDNSFSTPMQIVALSPLTPRFFPADGDPARRQELIDDGFLSTSNEFIYDPVTFYYVGRFQVDNAYLRTSVIRNFTIGYAEFYPLPGLVVRSEVGVDYRDQRELQWLSRFTQDGAPQSASEPGGSAYDASDRTTNLTTNLTASYAKTFGEHDLSGIVGYSYQYWRSNFSGIQALNFASPDFQNVGQALTPNFYDGGFTEYKFDSYFLRATYKFMDRYIFTASIRRDGSSRFGANNEYGYFPAGSVGWILSEEDFLSGISSTLSFLKIRASYGLTGNGEIGNYNSQLLAGTGRYQNQPTVEFNNYGNPDLKWESTATFEAGIEWGLFDNRISGIVAWYDRQTTDLLLSEPIPATGSIGPLTVLRNGGSLQNRGIEVEVTSNNLTGEFKWSTVLNWASNRTLITDIGGNIITSGRDDQNRAQNGEALGAIWLPIFYGVDPANGDALFVTSYNADGTPNLTNDVRLVGNRFRAGDPNPDFIGGVINNFSYKGISLSVFFQFSVGNDVYNAGGRFMTSNGWFSDNQTREQFTDAWRTPGQVTDVPRLDWNVNNGAIASSRYVYDASYLRLKTLRLAYSFPLATIQRLGFRSLEVFMNAQNVLTITDYPGWDPEVNTASTANINLGEDFYTAPQIRSYAFGVNVGF